MCVCVFVWIYIYIYIYIAHIVPLHLFHVLVLCTSNFRKNVSINFVISLDRLFIFYECEFVTISNIVCSSVLALTVLSSL